MRIKPSPPQCIVALVILALSAGVAFTRSSTRADQTGERKILCYQDSMHPWIKSDHPGKCTICGMDLTPIYAGEQGLGSGENLVVLSSNAVTVVNVQAEDVRRRRLQRTMRVAGTLEANETRKTVVASPARGRVDHLAVPYAGVEVRKGERLITLFSPELQQQNRILFATRLLNQGGATNAAGHNPYSRFDSNTGADLYSSDLFAPQAGVVVERNVYDGQFVSEGDKMFTIVDASVLWFRFDVYESQLPWFHTGQALDVTVPAVPGRTFHAVISFIEPTLDDATRTVKVRAEVQNPLVGDTNHPERLLRFGMYAEGRVRAEVENVLAIPRTAVLFPGEVAWAYVENATGVYARRRLRLGRQGDDLWEVLAGLSEGERVVTSGNVLIDAQSQFTQGDQPDAADAGTNPPAMPPGMEMGPPEAVSPTLLTDTKPAQTGTLMAMAREAKPAMETMPGPGSAVARSSSSAATPGAAAGMRKSQPGMDANEVPSASAVRVTVPPNQNGNILRMALRDQMQQMRWAAIQEGRAQEAAAGAKAAQNSSAPVPDDPPSAANTAVQSQAAGLTDRPVLALFLTQRSALDAFLKMAAEVSRAFAADDVASANQCFTNWPAIVSALQHEFPATHPWGPAVQRLAAIRWHAAKDLDDGRKEFLPFSTSVVELVQHVRVDEPDYAGLKVYHCPMAPKPGLWMQTKGPLRNPFYGSKMLTCGNEVGPPAPSESAVGSPGNQMPPPALVGPLYSNTPPGALPPGDVMPPPALVGPAASNATPAQPRPAPAPANGHLPGPITPRIPFR